MYGEIKKTNQIRTRERERESKRCYLQTQTNTFIVLCVMYFSICYKLIEIFELNGVVVIKMYIRGYKNLNTWWYDESGDYEGVFMTFEFWPRESKIWTWELLYCSTCTLTPRFVIYLVRYKVFHINVHVIYLPF